MTIRAVARSLLPPAVRRTLREIARELPVRARDFGSDIFDRRSREPLPPAFLRRRVARTSSRDEFVDTGRRLAASILKELVEAAITISELHNVLDFGCGSGRVARYFLQAVPHASLTGLDIDREAVAWCRAHLPGTYEACRSEPPTGLPSASFDLVHAVSVFSHLSEEAQDAWLAELARLLRPGGILVASTHSPELVFERPDLTVPQHTELQTRGFVFAPGGGSFNEDSAFHAPSYLRTHWSRWFEPIHYTEKGMAGFQDVSVFRKQA